MDRVVRALDARDNTLGVAPTGAGKTIIASAAVERLIGGSDARACVLAHRDELTDQNRSKFEWVAPGISTGVVNASVKDWSGQVAFAMVQTLARKANLDDMPALDLLAIDEAHHAAADSYLRIVDRARRLNPACRILGLTATPTRSDRRGLLEVFDNVADQITLAELIASGHLVPPKAFVIDLGVADRLNGLHTTPAGDYDMNLVSEIMNVSAVTEAAIGHWKEKAGDRRTVCFCSTVDHAKEVAEAFKKTGVVSAVVHGGQPPATRAAILSAYSAGEIQVLTNCQVLTEGWDDQPTSCVVLLRPCSAKSTMIQMVGRGLRTVDPSLHPGVVKSDCIVLDFGASILRHGSLQQEIDLAGVVKVERDEPAEGEKSERAPSELAHFDMREVDLLSNFRWSDIFGDGQTWVAAGFEAWACVKTRGEFAVCIGGAKGEPARVLSAGALMVCFAAGSDWLNTKETGSRAHSSRGWVSLPPSQKQINQLDRGRYKPKTRYDAACALTYDWNLRKIGDALEQGLKARRGGNV